MITKGEKQVNKKAVLEAGEDVAVYEPRSVSVACPAGFRGDSCIVQGSPGFIASIPERTLFNAHPF
jgi:hypothetical protein